MMDLDDLHFLLNPIGEQLLGEIARTPVTPDNHLQLASQLRQRVKAKYAQAVLETTLLRQLAAAKFSRASRMFFTRPALEQASSELIADYRARRFVELGLDPIADLGCGIGGDSLVLSSRAEVIGVDWDPVRIAMAQENVRVYGNGQRFRPMQADLLELTPLRVKAAFFDPARRDEHGRRFHSVHQYQPPLNLIDRWSVVVPNLAIKISPGVDYDELPEAAEIEFISVNGEVKEGVLWFGAFHSGVRRRATLLPGSETLTTDDMSPERVAITSPGSYLYEPDRAVIRAHLVEALAQRLGASKIDEEIAYLTADVARETPFARCFIIETVMPFQLKRLRGHLREQGIGRVTLKKRGSPLDLDMLRQQLRLRGTKHRILFLTQVKGEAAVVVGQELVDGS